MADSTTDSKREHRLNRMWPNEERYAGALSTCKPRDWPSAMRDDPPAPRAEETGDLFSQVAAKTAQSISLQVLAGSYLSELTRDLARLVSAGEPPHRAVIDGRTYAFTSAEAKFSALVETWRRDTMMVSDQTAILTHPSYYAIIGMGREALPYIFRDLATGRGPWFVALRAITQENPVAEQSVNSAKLMREDWLKWGKKHGYIRP